MSEIKLKTFYKKVQYEKDSYKLPLLFSLQLVFTFALSHTNRKKNNFKSHLFYRHFRLILCQLTKMVAVLHANPKRGLLPGQVTRKTNRYVTNVRTRQRKCPQHHGPVLLHQILVRNHIHLISQPNLPRLKNGCLLPALNKNHISFKDLNGFLREKHNQRKYLEDCPAVSSQMKWD